MGGETSPRPFSKYSKLSISLDLKFYAVRFYCMPSCGLSKYVETRLQTTCFHLISFISLYFVRYWAICLLKLLFNQVVTS